MHFNKGKAYGGQGKAPKGVKFAEALLLGGGGANFNTLDRDGIHIVRIYRPM